MRYLVYVDGRCEVDTDNYGFALAIAELYFADGCFVEISHFLRKGN